MKIITSPKSMMQYVSQAKQSGKRIGFVPTMGALHDGHFSLVEQSVKENDVTVVSIFVNPLQFGPTEDLDAYPRTFEADSKGLKLRSVDVLFFPKYTTFYDVHHQTYVTNTAVQQLYCGAYRLGHFDGVLTVVAKFFNCVQPDRAYFGKKDYQQAYLIRQMVSNLSYPIKIVMGKTVRDPSGLAMSSRNTYLSSENRYGAAAINKGLKAARIKSRDSVTTVSEIKKMVEKSLTGSGYTSIQYIEVASRVTLLPLKGSIKEKAVILVAVYFGSTRLIDNVEI